MSKQSRNVNKLTHAIESNNQTSGHETYHNEKIQALQSVITKLEARLREADRLNKDNHRIELIKSLRMQLRESLTVNETLVTLCGNHGIERHQIEPQLDAARARVKLVGIKKISEMRQEIELLRLQLKHEQTKKVMSKSNVPCIHSVPHFNVYSQQAIPGNEEKESDSGEQVRLLNESLRAECDALQHRLIVTIETLKASEERFQTLSYAHSQLKMSFEQQRQDILLNAHSPIVSADVLVDRHEVSRIEQHWSDEVKRLKAREARSLSHQKDVDMELDRYRSDIQQLVEERDELDARLADSTAMLEELRHLFEESKAKLIRAENDETLTEENFHQKKRVLALNQRARPTTSENVCRGCNANAKHVNDLRAQLRVARMINDSIKDTQSPSNRTHEFDVETMVELSEGYEKQIAELSDTVSKLSAQLEKSSSSKRFHQDMRSGSRSEPSLHDLEAEVMEL